MSAGLYGFWLQLRRHFAGDAQPTTEAAPAAPVFHEPLTESKCDCEFCRREALRRLTGDADALDTRLERVKRFCADNEVTSIVTRNGQVQAGDLTIGDLVGKPTALATSPDGPREFYGQPGAELADRPRGALVTDTERVLVAQRDVIEQLQEELAETRVTTAEMDRLRMEKADADRQRAALQKKYRPVKYPGFRYHRDGTRTLVVTNKAHEKHACVPHGEWYESPAEAAAAKQSLDAIAKAPAARKRLKARKSEMLARPALAPPKPKD